MSDNMTELGLSTESAVQEVLQLDGALDFFINMLDKVAAAFVKFNEKGEVAQYTVKRLDDALNVHTETFTKTKTGFEITAGSAADATVKYRDLADAMRQIREGVVTNQTSNTRQAEAAASAMRDATMGPNAARASTAEMNRYQAAIRAVTNEITRGKMTLQELDALWAKAASGATDYNPGAGGRREAQGAARGG